MTSKPTGPSDHNKRKLARKLRKTKRSIWRDVSDYLMAPRKNRVEVNLYRINKNTSEGDTIVVPGKILANGELNHKLTIACYQLSSEASKKILESGCESISIDDLLEKNPKGSNVKIFI